MEFRSARACTSISSNVSHDSGLGLLEAIPESTILSFADENDSDGDGISGKPNLVWDAKLQKKVLGRFGWKANEPTLFQQNQGAFLGDIGITSPLFPNQNCVGAQAACFAAPAGNNGNPEGTEISNRTAELVTFYTKLLGVPGRRNWTQPDVVRGKEIFSQIGCNACHKPHIFTGYSEGFPEISFQHIKPYTDLLLHDMGPDLADNREDLKLREQNGELLLSGERALYKRSTATIIFFTTDAREAIKKRFFGTEVRL